MVTSQHTRLASIIVIALMLSVAVSGCEASTHQEVEMPNGVGLLFFRPGDPPPTPIPDDETLIPPDPDCAIKGDVSTDDKFKILIYHMPHDRYYPYIRVNAEEGDTWFCTKEEAQDAGFVRSLR